MTLRLVTDADLKVGSVFRMTSRNGLDGETFSDCIITEVTSTFVAFKRPYILASKPDKVLSEEFQCSRTALNQSEYWRVVRVPHNLG